MKVKNLVFFGVAAAILSTASANAYTKVPVPEGNDLAEAKGTVTSKYYVDTAANSLKDDIDSKYDASNPNNYQTNVLEGVIVGENELTISNKKVTLGTAASANLSNATIEDLEDFAALANGAGLLTEDQYYDGAMVMQGEVGRKQNKISGATDGNITTTNGAGQTQDSGNAFDGAANNTLSTTNNTNLIPTSSQVIGYVTSQNYLTASNVTNKQDKPNSATNGHIATFDENKNNIDSGNAFDTANGTITTDGTTVIPTSAQVAGYVTSQGYLTSSSITNKQDKISNATAGDITTTDGAGQTQDSGKAFDTTSGTIATTNNSNLIPTSAQVMGYVQSQTNGIVIPARPLTGDCAEGSGKNCALVMTSTGMDWRVMAGN